MGGNTGGAGKEPSSTSPAVSCEKSWMEPVRPVDVAMVVPPARSAAIGKAFCAQMPPGTTQGARECLQAPHLFFTVSPLLVGVPSCKAETSPVEPVGVIPA